MNGGLRLGLALAIAGIACPSPAAAQVGAGTVVLSTHLGGDSVQAGLARLRQGATYRVVVRPAAPSLQIRPPAVTGMPQEPLTLRGLPATDTVSGGLGYRIVADRTGDHVVELTLAGAPEVIVEITIVSLARGDALAHTTDGFVVFNGSVGAAPQRILLDSGVVYRIQPIAGTVYLAPPMLSMPPVSFAPLMRSGGAGAPFLPVYSGEYRLYADGDVTVRVYRRDEDQGEMSCIRNPSGRGCVGEGSTRESRVSESIVVSLLSLAGVLAFILLPNRR